MMALVASLAEHRLHIFARFSDVASAIITKMLHMLEPVLQFVPQGVGEQADQRPSRPINLRPGATAISTRSIAVGRSTELAERTSDVT